MPIGSIIAAGSQLAGGLLSSKSANDAQNLAQSQFLSNQALQQEFAKKGIQWRVSDAKRAGVHPLYALGASIPAYSPSPIPVGAGSPIGESLSQAGQSLGRAVDATNTEPERHVLRMQELAEERGELENAILRADHALRIAGSNPPLQSDVEVTHPLGSQGDLDEATRYSAVDTTDPRVPALGATNRPDTDVIEQRYGDAVGTFYGMGLAASDMWNWLAPQIGKVIEDELRRPRDWPSDVTDRYSTWYEGGGRS